MRLERVIDFQNIGPNRTAILTLPLGPTYEALHFDLDGGLVVSDIESIVGLIDNKPFWTATGAEFAKQVGYEGVVVPGISRIIYIMSNALFVKLPGYPFTHPYRHDSASVSLSYSH
jgi:hypothetical protein